MSSQGTPRVSVVIVHYRAPELAAEAVERLRADCRAAGLAHESLIVDNGDDTADRDRLRALDATLIAPGENLGYAGGLNAGVRAARGEVLLLMNPDVLVLPGCVGALVAAVDAGADVAGPRFYWDRGQRMLLPPAEERTRRAELLGLLATCAASEGSSASTWASLRSLPVRRHRRRWRRHARHHWQAEGPIESGELSGALLAVRRPAWERVGPFDEGYRLYFEETDWLRRLLGAGGTAVHVPAAAAVHLYDRSASQEPRSDAWFERSRRRFERRWYGAAFTGLLAAAERLAGPPPEHPPALRAGGAEEPPALDLELPTPLRPPYWLELSPSPLGVPAAAERLEPEKGRLRWRLPQEIWSRLRPGRYRVAVSDGGGREVEVRTIEKGAD